MSAYHRRTVYIMMDCRHKIEIAEPAPVVGDKHYCIRCGKFNRVTDHLTNYRVTCRMRCTYTRNFGDDFEKAKTYARKHTLSKTTHVVEIFRDGKKVFEVTNVEEFLFNTPEEMAELAKQSVAALKAAFPGTEEIPF